MPESQEGQTFDEQGYCNVCRSSEDKMRIDWVSRRKVLTEILRKAREENKSNEYDCIIPISGGKDSTFQLHVLVKEFGMRPLAVTFSHNWFSATGMFNLFNALEKFDVDHIMFTPRRKLVNSIAKQSLAKIGDACWHCHAGVGAFPLRVARNYGIKLVIWGESASESSSRGSYSAPIIKFDQDYFKKVSAKEDPETFIEGDILERDMLKFKSLKATEYSESEITGIHLGDYIFWDEERQTEFVIEEYGWKEDEVEGTYKGYKSTECIMPGVHDFACYLKRGYGRTSFHLSSDIRSGLLSREDISPELIEIERTVPAGLEYYSKITGISLPEFIDTVTKHKEVSLENVELPIRPAVPDKKPKLLFL
jgi:N-acetyl sugar amidotransferase